jgi:hypothetical protein
MTPYAFNEIWVASSLSLSLSLTHTHTHTPSLSLSLSFNQQLEYQVLSKLMGWLWVWRVAVGNASSDASSYWMKFTHNVIGYGFSFMRFLEYTQWCTTVGRTPLDEWPTRRRDLYLTTHNTYNRQASIPLVGFEPKALAGERPQTYALERAATWTGSLNLTDSVSQSYWTRQDCSSSLRLIFILLGSQWNWTES